MSETTSATASGSSSTKIRPQTHKPRGVCMYYSAPRGCFAGDRCKFLHGEPSSPGLDAELNPSGARLQRSPLLTPYDQSKRCRYFARGYCKRGEECWFQHVLEPTSLLHGKEKEKEQDPAGVDSDAEAEAQCSICYEKPATYGLLSGCNHVFCISCIRKWRDHKGKGTDLENTGHIKKCPMCRESSNFITPSSIFLRHGTEEKDLIIAKYKESMAKVPCKYFERTKNKHPMCPFGKDCFYKHEKADGSLHVFAEGAQESMRRNRPLRNYGAHPLFAFTENNNDDARLFGAPFNMPFLELFNPAMAFSNLSQQGRRSNRQATQLADSFMGSAASGSGIAGQEPEGPPFLSSRRPLAGTMRGQTAADAVRNIARSLEVLNESLNTGATLERLTTAVHNLREQLRQEAHDAVEGGESADHLEVLARDMLSSIETLQSTSSRTDNPFSRSPSPSEPPLPHPLSSSRSRDRTSGLFGTLATDGITSDDEMPGLQSISNSSEEDYSSDSMDGSDSEAGEDSALGFLQARAWHVAAPSDIERGSTGPLTMSTAADGDDPPPLSPLLQPTSGFGSHISTPMPGPSSPLELPNDHTTFVASPRPPFMTDGRGRVVWTSNDDCAESPLLTPNPPASSLTETPLSASAATSPSTSSRLHLPGSPSSSRKSVSDGTITGEVATDGPDRVLSTTPINTSHPDVESESSS